MENTKIKELPKNGAKDIEKLQIKAKCFDKVLEIQKAQFVIQQQQQIIERLNNEINELNKDL